MGNYSLVKLNFITPLHSGDGDLADTNNVFYADTLFSALCNEAILIGGVEKLTKLVDMVNSNKVKFSDLFPHFEGEYYLPKPLIRIENREDESENSKKEFKKLKYIPAFLFDAYIKGELNGNDAKCENDTIKMLGKSNSRILASIKGNEESKPFSFGTFSFNDNAGIYLILKYENDEELEFIKELFNSLGYSGLGGKRSSGLGKFNVEFLEVPADILCLLENEEANAYITLSVSMCLDEELDKILKNSTYALKKRSGFIFSSEFAETYRRKNDFYVFASGSCFSKKFDGIIADVSGGRGAHPVYKYAKPLYLGVNI